MQANGHGAEAVEPIVEPDLPIIDTHFHLWNLNGHDYFAPKFVADISSGHRITGSVYAECGMGHTADPRKEMQPVGEVDHVLRQVAIARASGRDIADGMLGGSNLEIGGRIRPVLEAFAQKAGSRFKGIRARLAWDADPDASYGQALLYPQRDVIDEPATAEAARCIGSMGYVLDVWGFHTQLGSLGRLAAKCPDVPMMIDHCGGPIGVGRYASQRDEVFKVWAEGIREAASQPNLHIKLSGLGISRMGFSFGPTGQVRSSDELVAAWKRYIVTCYEAFGPRRCVFGSNFSVDHRVAPYPILVNAFKKMLSDLSADEKRAVFHDNAKRFYSL